MKRRKAKQHLTKEKPTTPLIKITLSDNSVDQMGISGQEPQALRSTYSSVDNNKASQGQPSPQSVLLTPQGTDNTGSGGIDTGGIRSKRETRRPDWFKDIFMEE